MIIKDESQLRVKCLDASAEEARDIILKLENELNISAARGRPGIGLAAIQIGIPKKVAIIRITGTNGKQYSINLVNARISQGFDKTIFRKEGCLSFPGKFVKTKRYKEIVVVDNVVEPHSFIATGLLSVCIQHELDHLDGILLSDLDEAAKL
ncbi:MAG: peptide deformylase [bacterium]|nr:peptide deformylase [bacterium]